MLYLLLSFLLLSCLSFHQASAQTLRYDVTGDGQVNVGDAVGLSGLIIEGKQNETIEEQPCQKEYRILDIGNSFSIDSNCYLDKIVESSGADVSNIGVYQLFKASSNFNHWVQFFNGQNTNDIYYFQKVAGDLDIRIPSDYGYYGGCKGPDLMQRALSDIKWDIIIIHQASLSCYKYEEWHRANYVYGDLDAFLDILHQYQPQARIDFLLVHAPYQIISKSKSGTSEKLWERIMQSAKSIQQNDGITNIIPAGTAVQNLRHTNYNDEYEMCRDGLHMAHGLARYAANCAYYQSIIYPITGVSILGNTYRPELTDEDYASSNRSAPIPVTDENAHVAQMAAYLATSFWWKTLNPMEYTDWFSTIIPSAEQ